MIDPRVMRMPLMHDAYLKLWSLQEPRITSRYILFDEAQDASPVMTRVVSAQESLVILVGDRHQQIYGFRGAIDALNRMNATSLYLTKSFRFGPRIADAANRILALKGEQQRIEGWDAVESSIGDVDTSAPYAMLCRTNAAIMESLLEGCDKTPMHVVGGVEEIVRLGSSAYALFIDHRQGIEHASIKPYKTWEMLVRVAEKTRDAELRMLVKLVSLYSHTLPDRLELAKRSVVDEASAHVLLSTSHKAKGREWNQVILAGDFPPLFNSKGELDVGEEELNLLYVSATRAKLRLSPNPSLREAMQVDAEVVKRPKRAAAKRPALQWILQ
jgi:superfamily I DNA/RNA helicase